MKPVLQVALDFINLKRAISVAEEAVKGGADWIEAGTPLIKSEGMDAIRALREKFPDRTIVADMKTMDAGRTEVETATKAGADIVIILGASSDATIRECIEAAANYGAKIEVDLIGVRNVSSRAKEVEKMGADLIGVHCSIDEQMEGKDPFKRLKEVSKIVSIPIAVAGGLNSETIPQAIKHGAEVLVVGGAIIKAKNPMKATQSIKKAIKEKRAIKTKLFKRAGEKDIDKILKMVSTANLSDAMHRAGFLKRLSPVFTPIKMFGKIVTVRTYPGDWSKPVQAIDRAEKGEVIVIDAGGAGPAVWGELATHGALQKGIAGAVVYGAVRDISEIKKLKFPLFTHLVSSQAGEPKGFGEINIPINIEGHKIFPGDWAVGDDDGIVIIPQKRLVEITNRAMNILELENRLREEIDRGSTLAKVIELLRWEKKT